MTQAPLTRAHNKNQTKKKGGYETRKTKEKPENKRSDPPADTGECSSPVFYFKGILCQFLP